jgi:hypothetical protein
LINTDMHDRTLRQVHAANVKVCRQHIAGLGLQGVGLNGPSRFVPSSRSPPQVADMNARLSTVDRMLDRIRAQGVELLATLVRGRWVNGRVVPCVTPSLRVTTTAACHNHCGVSPTAACHPLRRATTTAACHPLRRVTHCGVSPTAACHPLRRAQHAACR